MSGNTDKFCSQCGKETLAESLFCSRCGHKLNNLHKSTSVSKDFSNNSTRHVITFPKFLILSLLTFGMYQVYWGWKYWEIVKRAKGISVSPTGRGIFIIFTSFGLFKDVLKIAKKKGYEGGYVPWLIGLGFLTLNVIANALGKSDEIEFSEFLVAYSIILVLLSLLVSPVINAMNFYLKNYKDESDKFDFGRNTFLIIFLVALSIAVSIFSFAQELMTADYDEEVRAEFLNGCYEVGGDESFCDCFYEEVKLRYTLQEFAGFGLRGEVPPDIEQITNKCVSDN